MTTTAESTRRINLNRVSPEFYEAMVALSSAASKDLDPELAELIKIRASQMNQCAFCLDMHTADARKLGIAEQKLTLLPAWQEAKGIYTEQEQAALALTEEMTDLTHRHVSDEIYARAAAAFTERELAQVIAMALTINAWNRIGVTTRLPLPRR
jgi:AhpD family alkylhydroperoxidase